MYLKVVRNRTEAGKPVQNFTIYPLGAEVHVTVWPNDVIYLSNGQEIKLTPEKNEPWDEIFVYLVADNGDTAERIHNGCKKKD